MPIRAHFQSGEWLDPTLPSRKTNEAQVRATAERRTTSRRGFKSARFDLSEMSVSAFCGRRRGGERCETQNAKSI